MLPMLGACFGNLIEMNGSGLLDIALNQHTLAPSLVKTKQVESNDEDEIWQLVFLVLLVLVKLSFLLFFWFLRV